MIKQTSSLLLAIQLFGFIVGFLMSVYLNVDIGIAKIIFKTLGYITTTTILISCLGLIPAIIIQYRQETKGKQLKPGQKESLIAKYLFFLPFTFFAISMFGLFNMGGFFNERNLIPSLYILIFRFCGLSSFFIAMLSIPTAIILSIISALDRKNISI